MRRGRRRGVRRRSWRSRCGLHLAVREDRRVSRLSRAGAVRDVDGSVHRHAGGTRLARILAQWPGQATTAAAILLIAFSAFELRARLELTPSPLAAPSAYAAVRDDARAVIVELPIPDDAGQSWIDPTYLYYSTFHWRPLINGYSGFTPVWYPRLKVASREFPSDESMQVLRDRGATVIVLHQEFYPPDRYKDVVTALEQRQDVELVGARPASIGEIRVYRLRPR